MFNLLKATYSRFLNKEKNVVNKREDFYESRITLQAQMHELLS